MPYFLCKIHGGAIAPHGCRHVAQAVHARQPPGPTTYVMLDTLLFNGWVCPECVRLLQSKGLKTYLERDAVPQVDLSEKEVDLACEILDLQPMCMKCFQELSSPPPAEPSSQ